MISFRHLKKFVLQLQKGRKLVLTLRCPLYSDRIRLYLLDLVPSSLAAAGPCGHAAGIKAHVFIPSAVQLQSEAVLFAAGHCYIPSIQSLLILLSWYQDPMLIYRGNSAYAGGTWCVVSVSPGNTQTAISHIEEVRHLTQQLSRIRGKLGGQRGCQGHLKHWICVKRKVKRSLITQKHLISCRV